MGAGRFAPLLLPPSLKGFLKGVSARFAGWGPPHRRSKVWFAKPCSHCIVGCPLGWIPQHLQFTISIKKMQLRLHIASKAQVLASPILQAALVCQHKYASHCCRHAKGLHIVSFNSDKPICCSKTA